VLERRLRKSEPVCWIVTAGGECFTGSVVDLCCSESWDGDHDGEQECPCDGGSECNAAPVGDGDAAVADEDMCDGGPDMLLDACGCMARDVDFSQRLRCGMTSAT